MKDSFESNCWKSELVCPGMKDGEHMAWTWHGWEIDERAEMREERERRMMI
jgi:hypothetical protein